MTNIKKWSDILSTGETTGEGGKKLAMNLNHVMDEEITSHEKFRETKEVGGKFYIDYDDLRITFDQKGWTIWHWESFHKTGDGKWDKIHFGLTFRSEGAVETIKRLRAEKDGKEWKREVPRDAQIDPAQKLYEMEMFSPKLKAALQEHPLFVSVHISVGFIFVIYQDILFTIFADDFGNFDYELFERKDELETKLCKKGRTIGQGGILDRIKELRSAWDITHDPPGTHTDE